MDALDAKPEKRIPLDATNTPGDGTFEFIISQPGSYYMTANLVATKPSGIRIIAAGVTLDLNGFHITRASGTAGGIGVRLDAAANDCTVKNGSLSGWGTGVLSNGASGGSLTRLTVSNCQNDGIDLAASSGWQIDYCISRGNGSAGISASAAAGSRISNCEASDNGGVGISIGFGGVIVDSTAFGNRGSAGISTGRGCLVARCTARANTSSAGLSGGIVTGAQSAVIDCVASFNGSTAGTLTSTTGIGIRVDFGSLVRNCVARENTGDGIQATAVCQIRDNNAAGNGDLGGNGAGVHVTQSGNRIEGNLVATNDRGIDVDIGGNLVVKNSAVSNGTNYEIAAGNKVATIVTPTNNTTINGNTGGTSITEPWANFVQQ